MNSHGSLAIAALTELDCGWMCCWLTTAGSNIASFKKVAEAVLAQGAV